MGTNLLTYKLFISEVINRLNKAYKLDFEEHSSAGRAHPPVNDPKLRKNFASPSHTLPLFYGRKV